VAHHREEVALRAVGQHRVVVQARVVHGQRHAQDEILDGGQLGGREHRRLAAAEHHRAERAPVGLDGRDDGGLRAERGEHVGALVARDAAERPHAAPDAARHHVARVGHVARRGAQRGVHAVAVDPLARDHDERDHAARVVVGDEHGAHVRHARHGQAREGVQRGARIERVRQRAGRLGHEPLVLLGALALGEVEHGADHAHRHAARVVRHVAAVEHRRVGAVAAQHAVLVGPLLARLVDHAADARDHALPVGRMDVAVPPLRGGHDLVRRPAEQRRRGLVPEHLAGDQSSSPR
jgi:hypothetical protein